MNNSRLLRAKSIVQRAWTKDYLINQDEGGNETYCALGAIGKAYEDTGITLDNDMWYGDIPVEDVVVLAYEINPELVDELIERIKTGESEPRQIYEIVYNHNDSTTREEVADKFNGACKNYKKHEHKIFEFWEACQEYKELDIPHQQPINFAHETEIINGVIRASS